MTGNGHDGQMMSMLPIAMPVDGMALPIPAVVLHSQEITGGNSGDVVHAENYYIVNSSWPSQ